MPDRIAVAMSGGVDSSTAAWLLQQEGHDLAGVMLKMFDGALTGGDREAGRPPDGAEDARAVAGKLGIPFQVLDARAPFRAHVLDTFASAYERGLTPNPCVVCNRYVKFGFLLQRALALGCGQLATGHYARVEYHAPSGRWLLKQAVHREKDQSYVLAGLNQEQLSRSLFPLGSLSKAEVRSIAAQAGLLNAKKGDSQDICFIPDGDYGSFLRRYTGKSYPSGPFLDENGAVLGAHTGIIDYTLGQRRGLGVSSSRGRLYVKEVRPQDNTVVLSGNDSLYNSTLTAEDLNLIACDRLSGSVRLRAKVRYRMAEQPCTVEQTGPDTIRLTFDQPQRAITPGQSVVLYDGDTVVGGATIAPDPSQIRKELPDP